MAVARRKDDDAEESPFVGLQTASVLREARIFNERQLNPQKCTKALTKILYILGQGEKFTKDETTEVFFSVTKLFQSQDTHLRRLVYIVIKELEIPADESLIVVSCLSKDMTSKTETFRANSIRVLARIMDPSMVGQIERFLKQAIVDQSSVIVSSTLLAGQHLFQTCPDVVKRWVNEIQAALTSKSPMVQYQALALMHKIKKVDRLALSKVITGLTKNPPSGPLAQCLMLRICSSILETKGSSQPEPEIQKYITDHIHRKPFMVQYEAIRIITRLGLDYFSSSHLLPAITALQEFLTSPVQSQKFAAVHTLSEIVNRYPYMAVSCSLDLEQLIGDPNKHIAVLAIVTLLKTGLESNIDRLMKSMTGFMAEISDEFKMTLIDAIKGLTLKFKYKYQQMLTFMCTALREEGGFAYKQGIVNCMMDIIREVPESKECGLEQLCEFIEDCEFPELTAQVLHVLADLGPTTTKPMVYIRFIFNRIILETASVRAAAVTALARYAIMLPHLSENVVFLLRRCLHDNNDEVRDRALFYLHEFNKNKSLAGQMLFPEADYDLKDLEYSVNQYLQGDKSQPFDLKNVRAKADAKEEIKEGKEGKEGKGEGKGESKESKELKGPGVTDGGSLFSMSGPVNPHLELLNSIPEIKDLGAIWKSSDPGDLTESEAEYGVTCIKHIFPKHVLFQFKVTNGMESQLLENVSVAMEASDESWSEEFLIPIPSLKPKATDHCFVALQRSESGFASGTISCTLKFSVKDYDSATGEADGAGVEDEYQLEDTEVNEADFMQPGEDIGLVEFRRQWESMGDSKEAIKKYSLGLDTLQGAVNAVVDLLGLKPREGSGKVPEGSKSHTVNLSGLFFGKVPVLARAGFLLDSKPSVTLKIAVRSPEPNVSKLLTNAIR